jgi:hypothetical protein
MSSTAVRLLAVGEHAAEVDPRLAAATALQARQLGQRVGMVVDPQIE